MFQAWPGGVRQVLRLLKGSGDVLLRSWNEAEVTQLVAGHHGHHCHHHPCESVAVSTYVYIL